MISLIFLRLITWKELASRTWRLSSTATTQLLAAGSTKHDAEVEGRSSDELLPEQKTALTQLASGKADNGARLKLIPLLRSNRNALAYLGEQMKLLRPGTTRKPRAG
jgi:hypothetical protein